MFVLGGVMFFISTVPFLQIAESQGPDSFSRLLMRTVEGMLLMGIPAVCSATGPTGMMG